MKNILYLFSMISALALSSCAKTETDMFGRIHGIVTDAQGEPVRTAAVTLTGGKTTVTGSDGHYDFGDLEAGEYTVQVSKTGYRTETKRVNVEPGVTAQGDILLQYGAGLLRVNKSNIEFGTNSVLEIFEISNTGQHDLEWEIIKECEWITEIAPSSGIIKSGAAGTTVTIKIDRSKITGATKESTKIIVSSNGGGQDIIVSVNGVETPGGNGGGGSAVTNGLLTYYTFNDGTANDATDNKLDANLINTPDMITDTPRGEGKALFLNRNKEQYLNIPSYPFKDKYSYSVSFWIKDFGEGVIFGAIGTISSYSTPRLVCASGKLGFDVRGISNAPIQVPAFEYSVSAIQDGKWHLVTVSATAPQQNGTYTIKLYIDGKLTDTLSSEAHYYSNATKFQFGGKGGYTTDYSISMKLDNIRLYDRVLSDEDVKTIYEAEK